MLDPELVKIIDALDEFGRRIVKTLLRTLRGLDGLATRHRITMDDAHDYRQTQYGRVPRLSPLLRAQQTELRRRSGRR